MDDTTLIEHIYNGDRQAFNALADRYYTSLCAFAFRIVKDHGAAEDVVQDSLINLWINRNKILEFAHGKTYLYAIVKNFALSYIRADARRNALRVAPNMVQEDVSRYFIEQETYRTVMEAIVQLPPRTGEVIRLSLKGMRQEQIGEQMGITLATVKALKSDGLKKLRTMLSYLKIALLPFFDLFYG